MRQPRIRTTAFALIGLFSVACGYDNGSPTQPYYSNAGGSYGTNGSIPTADIDADATMSNLTPGEGVGMFIEYATGGLWTVRFTCDTTKTGITCPWSIDAQTLDQSAIAGIDVTQLDPNNPGEDLVDHPSPELLKYDGITTTEVDQFSFQVGAGLPVGFDIWLQYEPTPNRFVFWIGDGGLNRGVSSQSFDLYPTPAQ